MPVGTKIKAVIARTAGGAFGGVESVEFSEFTHNSGFTTTRTVEKLDVANSEADRYAVSTFWASDDTSRPQFTNGVATSPAVQPATLISSDAITQVNAVFPGTFS